MFRLPRLIFLSLGFVSALLASRIAYAEDEAQFAKDAGRIAQECYCMKEMPSSAIPGQPPEIFIDPVFTGVKRVIVTTNTLPTKYQTEQGQTQLPEPLRQRNLEAALEKLYTERFRKPECMAIPNCYNKENQPVTLMQFSPVENRKEMERLYGDPGTLLAFLQVYVIDEKRLGIEGGARFISVHLSNFRSGDVSPFFQTARPISFTDEVSEENLKKWIEAYIKGNISK